MDVKNAAQGIKGCDAIWTYDGDAAYAGMKDWAGLLLSERERLQNDIEGIIALAHDLLDALPPWKGQSSPARSAAARLTVACAAYPLPARPVIERLAHNCDFDGHVWNGPSRENEGMSCKHCGVTEAEDAVIEEPRRQGETFEQGFGKF